MDPKCGPGETGRRAFVAQLRYVRFSLESPKKERR